VWPGKFGPEGRRGRCRRFLKRDVEKPKSMKSSYDRGIGGEGRGNYGEDFVFF
jgi:hypothetical protein